MHNIEDKPSIRVFRETRECAEARSDTNRFIKRLKSLSSILYIYSLCLRALTTPTGLKLVPNAKQAVNVLSSTFIYRY